MRFLPLGLGLHRLAGLALLATPIGPDGQPQQHAAFSVELDSTATTVHIVPQAAAQVHREG